MQFLPYILYIKDTSLISIFFQGEPGQNKIEEFNSIDEAAKGFQKKFQDKTGNKWDARDNFISKSKKYTLLAIGKFQVFNINIIIHLFQLGNFLYPSAY